MNSELKSAIKTVTKFAEEARNEYKSTEEWTRTERLDGSDSSCVTIRVPVALLNRIRDLDAALVMAELESMG